MGEREEIFGKDVSLNMHGRKHRCSSVHYFFLGSGESRASLPLCFAAFSAVAVLISLLIQIKTHVTGSFCSMSYENRFSC